MDHLLLLLQMVIGYSSMKLNLAQDTVLQAIESALDTRQLTINNSSSAEQPVIVHRMHSDFSIVCNTKTQAPAFLRVNVRNYLHRFLSRFSTTRFQRVTGQ